jgi:hypothetical protein
MMWTKYRQHREMMRAADDPLIRRREYQARFWNRLCKFQFWGITMPTVITRFGIVHVVRAGVLGGVLFGAFEMLAAAVLIGPAAFYTPFRMIAAIVLGPQALAPDYSPAMTGVVAVAVHLVLSIGFAVVFSSITSPAGTDATLALSGMAFGIALWLVNFYGIATVAGWTWFPDRTNPIAQFVAHAFFYGCPVGWYLARSRTVIVHPSAS